MSGPTAPTRPARSYKAATGHPVRARSGLVAPLTTHRGLAERDDAGVADGVRLQRRLTFVSSAARCFASDTAMQVTTDAVQLLGGYGYVRDFPVERMMRDAKITQIYEGTNQIQRIVMARQLLKGRW